MAAHVSSLVVVMVGYLVQNATLNARLGEVHGRINDLRDEFREALRAEREVLRTEMARTHYELLHRFAALDTRLTRIEAERK